ncbi:hypothetical protein KUTeg_022688 [Tegillarca granosa]|uniref:Uncharacterized protein n=1 Tax=Tegillarca granosa TaxID=220873 RepID=A0ABQ9DZE5_TEGGR|nr:hypothetical protein KUTeg_022688 [Tegillarca granosa]
MTTGKLTTEQDTTTAIDTTTTEEVNTMNMKVKNADGWTTSIKLTTEYDLSTTDQSVTVKDVQLTTTDSQHSSTYYMRETTASAKAANASEQDSVQYCDCSCKTVTKLTFEDLPVEVQEKIIEMKENLTVSKKSLSSYIRAKTSAKDDRPSAQRIGSFGIVMLLASIFTIMLMDIDRILVVLHAIRENVKF